MPPQIYIIKGRLHTDIASAKRTDDGLYLIGYINNPGQKYYYKQRDVIIAQPNEGNALTPPFVTITHKKTGKELTNIVRAVPYQTTYQIVAYYVLFRNGKDGFYPCSDYDIRSAGQNAKSVFAYLSRLASSLGLKTDSGEYLLGKQYERIKDIRPDSPLSYYLAPPRHPMSRDPVVQHPVFPFGCNRSQYIAVRNALGNTMSVIQGPPGTGKTQTILNIIANLLIAEKTVCVVSNNNSAIDNVLDKLDGCQLGFLCAKLGRKDNRDIFFNEQPLRPALINWQTDDVEALSLEVSEISAVLESVYDRQEKRARLMEERNRLIPQWKHYQRFLQSINVPRLSPAGRQSSARLRKLSDTLRHGHVLKKAIAHLQCWWIFRRSRKDYKRENAVYLLDANFYIVRQEEISKEIREIDSFANHDSELSARLKGASMRLLKGTLAKRFSKSPKRRVFQDEEVRRIKEARDHFLCEYPIILSTTFSSLSSLGDDARFDYLIMDEASQVDVVTGALALHVADAAVIVGDTKQLPSVVTADDEAKACAIFQGTDIPDAYRYESGNSFLSSICKLFGDTIASRTLREHYRCHPMIIGFCNNRFYNGELLVMTDGGPEDGALRLERTSPGNHSREDSLGHKHINQREVDTILSIIEDEFMDQAASEIGVIAPYRSQEDLLKTEFSRKKIPVRDIGTVHSFQGREKNIVFLSTVDDRIRAFADDPHLLNVAVSRAKKTFVLVCNGNGEQEDTNINALIQYIRYNAGLVTDGRIRSVFDLLYGVNSGTLTEFIESHRKVSEYPSENLIAGLLEDIIQNNNITSVSIAFEYPLRELVSGTIALTEEEATYAANPWTHVDFLIYDRTSLTPYFAVEVDGYAYHKSGTKQAERDRLKDEILGKAGLPLIRLATAGSDEATKIEKIFREKGLV